MRSTRPPLVALLASVGVFVIALATFLVAGTPGRRVVPILSSERSPAQERALVDYMETLGIESCEPRPRTIDKSSTYLATVRATAAAFCDHPGRELDGARAVRFGNITDLKSWEQDQRKYIGARGTWGTCDRLAGESPWARRDGTIAGRMFCQALPDGNQVVWSDHRQLTAFAVTVNDAPMETVLEWWLEKLRGNDRIDRAAEEQIHDAFANVLTGGTRSCRSRLHQLADVKLECGAARPRGKPDVRVDGLTLYHFARDDALNAFFASRKRAFRLPASSRDADCRSTAFASGWYTLGGRRAGRVMCNPSGTSQWLTWTVTRGRLAGVIHRRDQSERALYRAWTYLFP